MKINELINLGSNELKFTMFPLINLTLILLSKVLGQTREEIILNLINLLKTRIFLISKFNTKKV